MSRRPRGEILEKNEKVVMDDKINQKTVMDEKIREELCDGSVHVQNWWMEQSATH